MKWTAWLFGSLTAALVVGCGGDRRNNDTGTAGGAGAESGITTDTAMPSTDTSGMASDTATGGARMHSDTTKPTGAGTSSSDAAKGNQTKSGVTDTKTGKSTLGKKVTQTRPDEGQPVTSKGDTVSGAPDSTGSSNR